MVSLTGSSFVDDTSLGITSTYVWDSTISDQANLLLQSSIVLQDLRRLAQHWERLLFTTGGALNLQKSHWYLLTWVWQNGIAKLATSVQAPGDLYMMTGNSIIEEKVPRISPDNSFRTLGVIITPNVNQTGQKVALRQASEGYHTKIGLSTVPPQEAMCSYMVYLRPKLIFPLPCSSLTQKQCRDVQAPALEALLPKLHLNRHTPRAVVFAGCKYGGLSLTDLYTNQSIGQLKLLLGHLKLKDSNSSLIKCNLFYLQLYVGSSTPYFHLPFSRYVKWIPSTWLTSIWKFVSQIRLTIDIEDYWVPKHTRLNDAMIMDTALTYDFSPQQLIQLNICHIYLQVFTISDIATADGCHLLPEVISGHISVDRSSMLHWPIFPRPPNSCWRIWRDFLQYLTRGHRLYQPLGSWISAPHQEWEWY
jgi:hypothetical protein